MKIAEPGLQYYVDRIKSGKPYTFVRYGDGEWSAAFLHDRTYTGSRSQQLNIPKLQKDMRRSLTHCHIAENYIPALRPTSLKRGIVTNWLVQNVPKGVNWHDCRVFYRSSKHGRLFPLVEALQNLDIPLIFVGPERLRKLSERQIFPKAVFITIPGKDCYVVKAKIIQRVLDAPRPAFISFTAGPAAKIMVYELYRVLGDSSFLFDFGSLWDIYSGHSTRGYQRRMTPEVVRRSLTGE